MSKYGILWEYNSFVDLDPFPMIPAAAMWVYDGFLVNNMLSQFQTAGVTSVLVVCETGAIFLGEAIQGCPEMYNLMSFVYFSDLDNRGGAQLLKHIIITAVHDKTSPILLAPGHIVSELSLQSVEDEHKKKNTRKKKKFLATVVVVPGKNETELNVPDGYRLTSIAVIESDIVRHILPQKSSLLDVFSEAEKNKQLNYYVFDGLMYECEDEQAIACLSPQ